MHDPNSLREQARRCRALSKTAVEPEVIEQLRVWAVELATEGEADDEVPADNTGREWSDVPIGGSLGKIIASPLVVVARGSIQPLDNLPPATWRPGGSPRA